MNEIYEKNLKLLKENYIEIYDRVIGLEHSDRVMSDVSVNGENILAVQDDTGRLFYLNSRYNDDEFTDHWVHQYDQNSYQNVYIIFGTSNFSHIKKLIDLIDDSNLILAYEPDEEIFFKSIQFNDITKIIECEHVILCVEGVNDNYFKQFCIFALNYSNIRLTNYCCMQNYNILYSKQWRDLIENIRDKFQDIIISRNTVILFSHELIANSLYNSRDFICQYSLNQLREALNEHDISDVPAIIVAAGPSLDKNIEELHKAKNKSMIIAVDTALKALLNHDIIPDIVVTIDPHKEPILFMHTRFKNIPILAYSGSNKELLSLYTGKRFYFDDPGSYIGGLYKNVAKEDIQYVESGGSVANNAFSLANILGFKNIILVGQDLAYPNNKMHTIEAYGQGNVEKLRAGKEYFEVEDIYGNKVLTEGNMNVYRKWFENQIVIYQHLNVIDATEGGAKIKGTQIMTLKEAIELECKGSVNVGEIMDRIPPMFTKEQQKELTDRIDNMPHTLREIEKTIKKGIRHYEKLKELSGKNKMHTKEFKNMVKSVGEISEYIEDCPELTIVQLYNKATEYNILATVYDIKDNEKDEVKDAADKGIEMLNAYINGINSLVKDLESMNKVNGEKIKENIKIVKENISLMKECCNSNETEKIDIYIKDFYQYLLELINRINMAQHNSDTYIHEEDDYVLLKDMLLKVVGSLEEKNYEEFTYVLTNIDECIEMIGDKYNELC